MFASLVIYLSLNCITFAENATAGTLAGLDEANFDWKSYLIHFQNINDRSESSSPYAIPTLFYEKSDNPPPMCYLNLGCFSLDSTWYDRINRPINVMPSSPDRIRTRFTLYTRSNPLQGSQIYANNSESILRSLLNPKVPTKFYIHGYGSSGYEPHIKTLSANWLTHGDYNVIVVHWGEGAFPSYLQAVGNIRVVGREVAHMISTLKKKIGVNPSDVHIIGHSLGAHAAGYVGEIIQNLGRITGVDPARPFFTGMPNHVRLDPTDANFVEAIHTDSGALGVGIAEPIGHLDFYPNGGTQQPGCNPSSFKFANFISSVMDSLGCNHQRGIHLYSDSLLSYPSGCEMTAFECSDSKAFVKGECSSCGSLGSCPIFGHRSSEYKLQGRQNIKLYFQAGPKAPYCRFHYFVTINLGLVSQSKPILSTVVTLTLVGAHSTTEVVVLRPSAANPLQSEKSHTILHTHETDIELKAVELRWEVAPGQAVPIGASNNDYITMNSINLKSANSKKMKYPIIMCPGNLNSGLRGKLTLGSRAVFTPNSCSN